VGDRTRQVLAFLLGLIVLSVAVDAELQKVISSSEVQAKIEAGQPVKFDYYTIVGNLDLSALKIEGPVHFNNTLFQNSVNFNSTTFNGPAYFESSRFNGPAYFASSRFNGPVDFWFSRFKGPTYFMSSRFNGRVDFVASGFNGPADFGGSRFNDTVNFMSSSFIGPTDFRSSRFNGPADFWYTRFNGPADFMSSSFNGSTYFWSSTFNGPADFMRSRFNGPAYFWSSSFNTTDFTWAEFDKIASFDDTQFNGITTFNNSRFKDDALFENTTFRDVLYLTRTKYDKFYIKMPSIKKGLGYEESAYQQLIENFKKLGYSSDVDNSYYQFRKAQLMHRDFGNEPLMYLFDAGAWVFYGYGKRPLYPLLWSIIIVTLYTGIWISIGPKNSRSKIDEYRSIERWPQNLSDALIFSATVFLSGTKLFVDPPAIPEISGVSQSSIRKAFTIERLLGALFSVLFFLAVTGMIIKST
jgi:hypothetical protein